jgi:dienelactone hydrolase
LREVGGIDSYVATPEGYYAKDRAVLLLTDVFGLDIPNSKVRTRFFEDTAWSPTTCAHQLLADDFARHGFYTVVPQLFRDCAPANARELGGAFNINVWYARNSIEYSEPRVRKVLAALKESGCTKVGVTGYCYGARTGFNFAFENAISALVISHPALLKIPEDIEVCVRCCCGGADSGVL